MSEQRKPHTPDEIRGLIERVERQLRESEALRHYANERIRSTPFFPDRRRTPRIPGGDGESSPSDSA